MPAEIACCPVCWVALTMPGPDAAPDPEHGPSGVRATCDACHGAWPTRFWAWRPITASATS